MSLFFKKKNPEEEKFRNLRRNAIMDLREEVANHPNMIKFDLDLETSVKNFVKERNIEKLTKLRIVDMSSEDAKPSVVHPALVEAIVNFLYTDMELLRVQGNYSTFEDSVDNMIFVMY